MSGKQIKNNVKYGFFLVLFFIVDTFPQFISPGVKFGGTFGRHGSFFLGVELSVGYIYPSRKIPFCGGVFSYQREFENHWHNVSVEIEGGGTIPDKFITPGISIGYSFCYKSSYLRPFIGYSGTYLSYKKYLKNEYSEVALIEKPLLLLGFIAEKHKRY